MASVNILYSPKNVFKLVFNAGVGGSNLFKLFLDKIYKFKAKGLFSNGAKVS
jgi:hypothetical protein